VLQQVSPDRSGSKGDEKEQLALRQSVPENTKFTPINQEYIYKEGNVQEVMNLNNYHPQIITNYV